MSRRAFTLVELLIVMAIMAFMGTVAVGGYRSMRLGMAERGAIEDANQFIRAAYQRAQIDRAPVAVYFWNETLQKEETDRAAVVVGKAVAVRRSGRFSKTTSKFLYDEFADLIVDSGDDGAEIEGDGAESQGSGAGVFVYKLNGNESKPERSTVYEIPIEETIALFRPIPGKPDGEDEIGKMSVYAYQIISQGNASWKSGDAYGFEFASIQLPHGYMFGSKWEKQAGAVTDPECILFSVGANSGSGAQGGTSGRDTIEICTMKPDASGKLSAKRIGATTSPTQDLKE